MRASKAKINLSLRAVIVLGSPGSGKGTQTELLAAKFNLWHLETSKVLEEWFRSAKENDYFEVEGKKYYARAERNLWEDGILSSPPLVTYLVEKRIQEIHSMQRSIITSGSPRTLYETEKEYPLLQKLYGRRNIKVLVLEIKEKIAMWRNSHRRICELMRHPIIYTKETVKLTFCPLDGSKLARREGLDDPEVIKVRLKEYRERTFPIIEYFEKCGVHVKNINGDQSVAEVFQSILEALEEK